MKNIKIDEGYIKLGQLLKLSGVVNTGGQSKYYIMDGRVKVNGQIVSQRGKKIFPGDIVEVIGILEFMVIQ